VANELSRTYVGAGTPYALIRQTGGDVWNGSAFVTFIDADIATYDVPLASQGGDLYATDFPEDITQGTYLVQYYEANGVPTISDLLLDSEPVYWSGTEIVTPPASYAGRYTTLAEIETWLDSLNFIVHSDSDRDGDGDDGAKAQAHRSGEALVDLYTGGPYTFDATASGTAAEALFNRFAYVMAGYELAAKRGFRGNQENEFRTVRQENIDAMLMFKEDPWGVEVEDEDEDDNDAGTFQFITVNRGIVCEEDD
jgi:hypothetical protein